MASASLRRVTSKFTKPELVNQLLNLKEATGKTFTQIAQEIKLTNLYTAQLFFNQAQLKEGTVEPLKKAVPGLTDDHIAAMKRCPFRSYDPSILQEPHIYRMQEAVHHYGEAVKAVMNEELGDGIMSAIDMFSEVKIIEGAAGEKRVCLILNGKFLPHVEQKTELNTAGKY